MNTKIYYFLTNEESNKGYSSSVRAMAACCPHDTVIDAKDIKNLPKDAVLVSAGNMGYELLKKYGNGQEMILATDRYSGEDLDALNCHLLTIIAPQCELDKYKAATRRHLVLVSADMVAAPTKSQMEEWCHDFIDNNTKEVFDSIFENRPEYYFFFGGRVADYTQPTGWKENTVEQFEDTAEHLMLEADGRNTFVVFHGLRSRTRGDKSNDFAPQNAAIAKLREMRADGQVVLVLGYMENGPSLLVIKDGEEVLYPINNANAGGYYLAIHMAVKSGGKMVFTAEQMNFMNEALTMGSIVNWRSIRPFGTADGWLLTVPSNEETHRNVYITLKEQGIPMTQVEAFRKVIA